MQGPRVLISNLYIMDVQMNFCTHELKNPFHQNQDIKMMLFCFQYAEVEDEEMESKDQVMAVEAAKISQFYNLLTSSIDVIFKFCDKIPGYNDLCKDDRELLFRSACLELFTLRLSHRSVLDIASI